MIQVIYAAGATAPAILAYVISLLNISYTAFGNCTIFISLDYQTIIAIY